MQVLLDEDRRIMKKEQEENMMREDDQRDMGQPEAKCKCRVPIRTKPFLIGENYMRVNNSFCGCVVGHKVENYSSQIGAAMKRNIK